MLRSIELTTTVLSRLDPDPVEIVNADGKSAFLLTCEHAGRAVPVSLGDLGIDAAEMDRHIAYDVGAEGLSRQMASMLDAPLIVQRYSRLVVDCNRPSAAPDCFPEVSDSTIIPANVGLSERERRRRLDEIHRPFHGTVGQLLDRRAAARRLTILVAVHSFTSRLVGGSDRPWQLGVLSNRDSSFAERFLIAFRRANPDMQAAHNEPYVVDDTSDYTIPVHGEARGLPHVLLEIRNDLIADAAGQGRLAGLIAACLNSLTSTILKELPDGR